MVLERMKNLPCVSVHSVLSIWGLVLRKGVHKLGLSVSPCAYLSFTLKCWAELRQEVSHVASHHGDTTLPPLTLPHSKLLSEATLPSFLENLLGIV